MRSRPRIISGKPDPEASAQVLADCQDLELGSFRLLNKWLPKVLEWELKVELGKHIWEEAQHVDALRRRRSELVEAAEPPMVNARVNELLSIVGNDACAACFLVALYGVLKPRLLETYQDHVGLADVVAESPTVRVLERIVRDETEHIKWGEQVIVRLGAERHCGKEENKRTSMAAFLNARYGEPACVLLREIPQI